MPLTAKQDESVLRLSDVIKKGCFQQIRFLVDIGIDIDERDGEKKTPLMLCALMEPELWGVGAARLLIEKGASIDCVDKYGMNALHYACVYERTDLVKVLLNAIDFDINQSDRYGNTALHYAARSGHSCITSMLATVLRRYKLSQDKDNKHGRTALEEAERLSHKYCAQILRSSECILGDDLESVRSRSPISMNLRTYRENSADGLSRYYSSGLLRPRTSLPDRDESVKRSWNKPVFRRSQTLTTIYRKQPPKQLPPNKRDENKLINCASLTDFRNTLDYLLHMPPIELFSSTSRNATPKRSKRPKTGFGRTTVSQNDKTKDSTWKTEFKILIKHYEYQCSPSYRPSAMPSRELPHLGESPPSPSPTDEMGTDDIDNRRKGRRSSIMGKMGLAHADSVVLKKKTPVTQSKSRKTSLLGQNVKSSIPVIDGTLASSNESLNSNMSAKRQATNDTTPTSPKISVEKQSKAAEVSVANVGRKKPGAPEIAAGNASAKKPDEKPGRVSRTGSYKIIPTVTIVDEEIDATSEGSASNPSNVDPNYLHVLSDIDEQ